MRTVLQLQFRFVLALGLAILELAEVHDAGNRRFGEWRDFHQIEFRRFRPRDRIRDRHDTELFTFCTDQADLRAIDFAVDPLCFVLGYCVAPQ